MYGFARKHKSDFACTQIPFSGNGWSYVPDDLYYFVCRPLAFGHGLDSLLIVIYSYEEPLLDSRVIELVLSQETHNAAPDFTLICSHRRNIARSRLVCHEPTPSQSGHSDG